MDRKLVAEATIAIDAPVAHVWDALTNPDVIKQYMFGTQVVTDWKAGSPIIWKGEWQGRAYEDKGTILQFEPERLVQYTHYSPLSGAPDLPENYHTVTVTLASGGTQTTVSLAQDNNETAEERDHSRQNWQMMLEGLKRLVESG